MKTKNDLKTGILIGIGMIVIPLIIMSSKPISTSNYSTPESHVWEMVMNPHSTYTEPFLYNKVTGEVRKYSLGFPTVRGKNETYLYIKMKSHEEVE